MMLPFMIILLEIISKVCNFTSVDRGLKHPHALGRKKFKTRGRFLLILTGSPHFPPPLPSKAQKRMMLSFILQGLRIISEVCILTSVDKGSNYPYALGRKNKTKLNLPTTRRQTHVHPLCGPYLYLVVIMENIERILEAIAIS